MDGPEYLRCPRCRRVYIPLVNSFLCNYCKEPLEPQYGSSGSPKGRGVWRYSDLLPRPRTRISLGEGGTPLVELDNLSKKLGVKLYAKAEYQNPTGSFKDRGMSVGVSIALSFGYRSVISASTGNTAASMSSYARKASLKPLVVLPRGKVARGKSSQIASLGSRVIEIEGTFDNAIEVVLRAAETSLAYPLNSFNPYRLEGQKTIGFEIAEELGEQVDLVIVPVGNAGNIAAIWKGFKESPLLGLGKPSPRMIGVQAQGASPIVDAWMRGDRVIKPVKSPETIASAIRIGSPVNGYKAIQSVRESKGTMVAVSDSEILESMVMLSREEGILVEPASAASLAGLIRLKRMGAVRDGSVVVLILTGHGLKDPDALNYLASAWWGRGGEPLVVNTVEEALHEISRYATL